MADMSKKLLLIILLVILLFVVSMAFNPYKAYAVQTKKIIVDPGHGGIDYGCTIKNLREKDITLDISREIKSYLENEGYTVMLTRGIDESLSKYCKIGGTTEIKDLNARVNMINTSGVDIFVSIHANSFLKNPNMNGSIVYFYSTDCLHSRALALSIQNSLNNLDIHGSKRMPHISRTGDYYILRKTALPGVLIETGFMSSAREREWFSTKVYKQNLAKSIVLGIERYMENKR